MCRTRLSKITPMMPELDNDDESLFGESYCTEDESNDSDSSLPPQISKNFSRNGSNAYSSSKMSKALPASEAKGSRTNNS